MAKSRRSPRQTLSQGKNTSTVPISITNTTGAAIHVEDFQLAVSYINTKTTTPFTISSVVLGTPDSGFTFGSNTTYPGVVLVTA